MVEEQVDRLKYYVANHLSENYYSSYEKDVNFNPMIKNSILEKAITKFIFQYKINQEYGLTHIINYIKEINENQDNYEEQGKKVKSFLEDLIKHTKNDYLVIYSKIIELILNFPKQHTQNLDYGIENVVKIEKLLQEHIDSNFFYLKNSKKVDTEVFNEQYVKSFSERHDFNYSITSIFTLFEIMKKLETHNVQVNDNETFTEDGLMTEKKLQIFERQVKKQNISYSKLGNLAEYLINEGNIKKLLNLMYSAESSHNNFEIEQKLCLSVFLLKKIIKDYSFYFSKQELENIFIQVKKFKDFPLPIGSLGMDLFEILINELYFQGVTIMNKVRELHFIDSIDPSMSTLNVKHFNSIYLVYNEDESINRIFSFIIQKLDYSDREKIISSRQELIPREFLVKIFISVIRNSTFPVTNSIIEYIVKKFMTNQKKTEYNKGENNDENSYIEEKHKKVDNTHTSIKKILRIIDVGLDKNYEEFLDDIQYIAEPFAGLNETYIMGNSKITNMPITDFREYLNPVFELTNKLIPEIDYNINSCEIFNLYKTYFDAFSTFYIQNFQNLEEQENDIDETIQTKKKKRRNLFDAFKLKILIIEDKKCIYSLLDQLQIIYKSMENIEKSDDWEFWTKFISNTKEFNINLLAYIVPNIDNLKEVFPKTSEESRPYLSEFIANNDHIYQTFVYYPWLSKKDFTSDPNLVDKLVEFSMEKNEFKCIDESDLYSIFLNPLNLYTVEAEKVFNLYLYKVISLSSGVGQFSIEKMFWRSVEIDFHFGFYINKEDKKKKIESNQLSNIVVEVTLYLVDALGIKLNNNKISIKMTNPLEVKILNVFSKKDSPMHFNMKSNSSFLDVFILGKYIFYKV